MNIKRLSETTSLRFQISASDSKAARARTKKNARNAEPQKLDEAVAEVDEVTKTLRAWKTFPPRARTGGKTSTDKATKGKEDTEQQGDKATGGKAPGSKDQETKSTKTDGSGKEARAV